MNAYSALPEKITVDGIDLPIRTDFRIGIEFEALINDYEIDDRDKIIKSLELYFDLLPAFVDPESLIDQLMWFYNGGKDRTPSEPGAKKSRQCDLNQDSAYIATSFLQAYNIDLSNVQMHWWRFLSLLEGLPEDTQYSKILGYRCMNITKEMSKEQKKHYAKMKHLYKLKDNRPQWMIDEEFSAGFLE